MLPLRIAMMLFSDWRVRQATYNAATSLSKVAAQEYNSAMDKLAFSIAKQYVEQQRTNK